MNVVDLCPKPAPIVQYRNGTQTNKDMVEYQAQYRKKRKQKKPYVFEVRHGNETISM